MMGIGASHRVRRSVAGEYLALFALFAVPIGMATAVAVFLIYHFDVQMVRQNLHETEHHHLNLREALIRENVSASLARLRLLSRITERHSPQRPDPADDRVRAYLVFCSQFESFRRLRSVTVTGAETARVICDGKQSRVLRPGQLSGATEAKLAEQLPHLAPGDVYISGIDMVADEDGAHVRHKGPIVHFAIAVQDAPDDTGEFLVADVDLRHLVSDLMLDTGQGGTMVLVESDGRFVRKPLGDEHWGDTLAPGTEMRFGDHYPVVWRALQQADTGIVEAADGVFAFSTLNLADIPTGTPLPQAANAPTPFIAPVWRIVSHVPAGVIASGHSNTIGKMALLVPAPLLVALYLAHVGVRRRRAARDLEESERYLRQIMDSVVDGIITTDPSGRIEQANAATRTMFGLSQDDAPEDLSELIPLEALRESGPLAHFWQAPVGDRRPARTELTLQRRDGSEFPTELVLMESELSEERRLIWVIRDVSERHAFEAKQNAERMRFFHQTKMAEIGLIAAGIIHEVGNPIAAISGVVTELSEEAEQNRSAWSADMRDKLNLVAQHARRLSGITREISDFVRTRPGEIELFDFNSLIRSITRLVGYDARWKSIGLDLDLDPEIPAIMGMQDQVAQMLMNLLVNAGDAVQDQPPERRQVRVRTENRGSHVLLEIADKGHGMSEETRRRAFDEFFTTKPEGKGTGLGLSLCLSIVSAHQGSIEVDSDEDRGATIRISFPVPGEQQAMTG